MIAAMYRFLLILFTTALCGQHHKIQMVLTNPRTVSTVFEKAMIARGDHKVFHEPWVVSYMYHEGNPEVFSQLPPLELREAKGYEAVKSLIYRWAEQQPVFLKDMIWCMGDDIINDVELLSDPDLILTFLIRDPARSIESFFLKGLEKFSMEKSAEFTELAFRYDELYRIAEKYLEIRGEWPIIVEAEELCKHPKKSMKAFCRQAGIPYLESSLKWEKGMPEEWKHLSTWHKDAADSKGFYVPERDKGRERFTLIPDEYKPFVERVYQDQYRYYRQLLAMRRK
jgi:Sulfotransferase domain